MKILYICTHNRCRSILCEALTNSLGRGHFTARSAGSQPVGEVHPDTLRHLSAQGINVDELKSQSWDEFADFHPDVVVTVCDSAAHETCPLWMANDTNSLNQGPIRIHWPLADPSKVSGSKSEVDHAFQSVIAEIKQRVSFLLNADTHNLSREERIVILSQHAQLVA